MNRMTSVAASPASSGLLPRLAGLAALLLLLSGCTAHSLSSLQQQFNELQTTRDSCESGGAPASAVPVTCLSSYDGPLLDLARQARDAAPQAEDPRTRIAFLSLAAMAGWQSRTGEGLDLTDSVSGDGVAECDALDKSKFGVPRDCALLELAPAFARHVRAVDYLRSIHYSGKALTDEQRAALAGQAGTYIAGTWNVLASAGEKLKQDSKISPSVVAYLQEQRRRVWCVAKEFERVSQEAGETAVQQNLQQQTDPIFTANQDLQSLVCNDTLIGQP
jgi:hypothetical protein